MLGHGDDVLDLEHVGLFLRHHAERPRLIVLDEGQQIAAVQVPLDHVRRLVGDEQQVEVPLFVGFGDFDEFHARLPFVT